MQSNTYFKSFLIAVGMTVFLAACSSGGTDEGVGDTTPPPQPLPLPPDVPVEPAGPDETLSTYLEEIGMNVVLFDYDSSDLDAEDRAILQTQARWLNGNSFSVTVEGHADERGTRDYNLALGDRRANSIKNYLVALGVSADRINTISYGKERPVRGMTCSAERCWSQNRRGVVNPN